MTGELPLELWSLTNLSIITIWGNGFVGTIDSRFGLLDKLEKIWLADNRLTGPLPSEMGLLSRLDLIHFGKYRYNRKGRETISSL